MTSMGRHSLVPLPFTENQIISYFNKNQSDRPIFRDPLSHCCVQEIEGRWVGVVLYVGNNFLLFWAF